MEVQFGVIFKEDRSPTAKWLVSRVLDTQPVKDGLMRVLSVWTAGEVMRRTLVKALLKRYEEEGDHFLDQIVTGDESWCYHYDPSTKRASMEWKRGDSPRPKKIRCQRSAGFEVLEHPAYSPGLAPSDYFLFGLLKKELKGTRFDSDEDVQKVAQDFFHTLPKSAYKEGIYKLPERWRRCIESQGDYFE
ncbi:hypothetical protein LAZ67_X000628 [Cordylochernes scorpioides]|uniref:DUF5641 domain-containing protein n=1 Tax=Cordylochernes scorpioides TaxID=51811 RepID=A0ABY6LTU6_9ARAC|nr:hypothetical protein LAZ67_X000628 [Cordylochernes scorpioides]